MAQWLSTASPAEAAGRGYPALVGNAAVTFKGLKGKAFLCAVTSPQARTLQVRGVLDDIAPNVQGPSLLSSNPALVSNLWSYAKQEKMARLTRSEEKRKAHRKAAKRFLATVEALAADVELLTSKARDGWCSECLTLSTHVKVDARFYTVDVYLCDACGSRTAGCPAPGCSNMASRGTSDYRVPKYCAEQRHDIPGFEKASALVDDLADYEKLLAFEKKNLSAVTKVGTVAAVITAGTAVTIASGGTGLPAAVGGAIGSLQGLSGAAAISSGLATLGGGSLAVGGLGMAGGTLVVAAGGSALAGGLGASVMSAYVGDDKSFRIEKLHDGDGIPVIVANGFLTEGRSGAHQWEASLLARYPDSPIYELHWGSKDLKKLAVIVAPRQAVLLAWRQGGMALARQGARAAARNANLWLVAPQVMAGFAKNPWHTAKNRADKTGVALASLLARTHAESYVLAGHSLGGRVMAVAAETLATSTDAPRVREMHLLGAALGTGGDWRALSSAVQANLYNYHSSNDQILKWCYQVAQAGNAAVGNRGFGSSFANIKDVNVSRSVKGHSEYWGVVKLR